MDELHAVVESVLSRIKVELKTSTCENRKTYFNRLLRLGEKLNRTIPCQELYDAFVADASTPDLRFQLYHLDSR